MRESTKTTTSTLVRELNKGVASAPPGLANPRPIYSRNTFLWAGFDVEISIEFLMSAVRFSLINLWETRWRPLRELINGTRIPVVAHMCMNISHVLWVVRVSIEVVLWVSNFAIIAMFVWFNAILDNFAHGRVDFRMRLMVFLVWRIVSAIVALFMCNFIWNKIENSGVFRLIWMRENMIILNIFRSMLFKFNFFIYSKDKKFPARIELLQKFNHNFC